MKKSLLDEITDLCKPQGEDIDPEAENDLWQNEVADDEEAFDDEVPEMSASSLRRRAAPTLLESEPRYSGKTVSRREVVSSEDEDLVGSASDDGQDDDEESESSGEDEDNEESDGDDESTDITELRQDASKLTVVTARDDVAEGKAVQEQLRYWDGLMQIRIQLQQAWKEVNSLPLLDSSVEGAEGAVKTADRVLKRLAVLEATCSGGDVTEFTATKKRRTERLAALDVELSAEWREVLNTWDHKTRLVNVRSGKNFAAFDRPIVQQIEQILTNKPRLVARCHVKRQPADIIGMTEQPESHCELFDDGDFYAVQLKDVIEKKSHDSSDPALLGKKFAELEALKKKKRKAVDTKASKGRRLRYETYQKLVNFMAPVVITASAWTDEQCDKLFTSLFAV